MKQTFKNELETIVMFIILVVVRAYAAVRGVTVDAPALNLCIGVLSVILLWKFYTPFMNWIESTIPDDTYNKIKESSGRFTFGHKK